MDGEQLHSFLIFSPVFLLFCFCQRVNSITDAYGVFYKLVDSRVSHAHMVFSRTPQRGMRSLAQGKRSRRRSGTLGKKPHGPRPTGARGNISKRNFQSSLLPRCLSLRPATCCPVAFPFGRRRAAPLPFPSAGDLRFGAFPSSVDIRDCPCENMMHYF